MSSYSPVAIVKEAHFCQGVTFAKCINTFPLAAQNPDIPEGKAGPSGSILQLEGKQQKKPPKNRNIEK